MWPMLHILVRKQARVARVDPFSHWVRRGQITHSPNGNFTMVCPCPQTSYNHPCWRLHPRRQTRCSQLQWELQELRHPVAQHCSIIVAGKIAEAFPSRDRKCCLHRYRSRSCRRLQEFARSDLQPHPHLALRAYPDALSHRAVAMASVVHLIQKEESTGPGSLTLTSE